MPTKPIQAITFDVGGTLIAPVPSVGSIYSQVAQEALGIKLDTGELERRFITAWQTKEEFDHSRQAWERIVDATFADLLEEPPSRSFFPTLYQRFGESRSWRIFDDVLPALEEFVMRGIPLAIVSNWDERLRPLLRALKLSGYFDTILISSEVYFAKPSNVIFEHAIRSLGVPAESILHIGDSIQEDVRGAHESGMQSVLLNRTSGTFPSQISSLREVFPWLADSGRGSGD